jgi:hypothetical protein
VGRSPAVNRIRDENEDLLKYLKEYTGTKVNDVIALSDRLYDTLFIEVMA